MDEKNPHEKEWERIMHKNVALSNNPNDIYTERAEACKRLLVKYC